jgi:hypothetical protein
MYPNLERPGDHASTVASRVRDRPYRRSVQHLPTRVCGSDSATRPIIPAWRADLCQRSGVALDSRHRRQPVKGAQQSRLQQSGGQVRQARNR